MTFCIGYGRVSTDKQDRSFVAQHLEYQDWATSHGYTSVGYYSDYDHSGDGSVVLKAQEQLLDMISACDHKGILWVRDETRVARCVPLAERCYKVARQADWTIQTREKTYGLSNRDQREFIDACKNGERNNDLRRKGVVDNMERRSLAGEWQHDRPFGFDVEKANDGGEEYSTLVPNMLENMEILNFFEEYANSRNLETVVDLAMASPRWTEKHQSRDRATHRKALRILFQDLKLVGFLKTKLTGYEVVDATWQGIVPLGLYMEVSQHVASFNKPRRPDAHECVLRSIMFCAVCGQKMTAQGSVKVSELGVTIDERRYVCKRGPKCSAGTKSIRIHLAHAKVRELIHLPKDQRRWEQIRHGDPDAVKQFLAEHFPLGLNFKGDSLSVIGRDEYRETFNTVTDEDSTPVQSVEPTPVALQKRCSSHSLTSYRWDSSPEFNKKSLSRPHYLRNWPLDSLIDANTRNRGSPHDADTCLFTLANAGSTHRLN